MSTTRSLQVALAYSASECSVLLKLVTTSFRERGADLAWVSAFPGEAEVLYPPLTYLSPTGVTEEVLAAAANGGAAEDDGRGQPGAKWQIVEVRPSFG